MRSPLIIKGASSGVVFAIAAIWLVVIGASLMMVWRYEVTPGPPATAGPTWPMAVTVDRNHSKPTLLVFLHPQCDCSVATVRELARLMTHLQNRIDVRAFVYRPTITPTGWTGTALSDSAAGIPGVEVMPDDDGAIARKFGAKVSGQALLYEPGGRLIFSGGLTSARGHAGDNEGTAAIQDWVLHDAGRPSTPVFGCLLSEDAS